MNKTLNLRKVAVGGMLGVALFLGLPALYAEDDQVETLMTFTQDNGAYPMNLIQTKNGDFYGVTYSGGKNNKGTLFRIPLNKPLVTLVTFGAGKGEYPLSRPMEGRDGNLYGTTTGGGTDGQGTIFRVSPDGKFKVIASFNGPNGSYPMGDLIAFPDGNFYGCTMKGGDHDAGTVFAITPEGACKTLASFDGLNGAHPQGLSRGTDGYLYGSTADGGTGNMGTIFRVGGRGEVTSLHSFVGTDQARAAAPISPPDENGFYGTMVNGGKYDLGAVYAMNADGTVQDIADFNGINGAHPGPDIIKWFNGYFYMSRIWSNGSMAKSSVVQWSGVNFCGTTSSGGMYGHGTVFLAMTSGSIETLVSFTGEQGKELGSTPNCLIAGNDGNLYGTTTSGGHNNVGTIYRLRLQSWTPPGAGEHGAASNLNLASLPPVISP